MLNILPGVTLLGFGLAMTVALLTCAGIMAAGSALTALGLPRARKIQQPQRSSRERP